MLQMKFAIGALMLVGILSAQAGAQQYKGKFSLPVEAYWGGTVLQPGEYTMWIENEQPGTALLRVSGNGKTATAMIGSFEYRTVNSRGRIVLAEVDGIYALRQLDAGVLGKLFSFTLPRAIHEKVDRASMPAAVTEIAVH